VPTSSRCNWAVQVMPSTAGAQRLWYDVPEDASWRVPAKFGVWECAVCPVETSFFSPEGEQREFLAAIFALELDRTWEVSRSLACSADSWQSNVMEKQGFRLTEDGAPLEKHNLVAAHVLASGPLLHFTVELLHRDCDAAATR
jgi:hypothetical protein